MRGAASSFPVVSYLFVPANRPERFDKACAAGADQVIIDLEDAVPPEEKDNARECMSQWLHPAKMVAIRINSSDSPWFEADLALCAHAGVAAVIVPKAATTNDIARVHAAGAASILPLIEGAAGMAHAGAIASAPGVARLLFGTIDFCVDLGIESEDRELDYFRSHLVLVSRLANIAAPVDGVTTAIDDVALIRADTLRGKRFGFGGKLCIHPKQLATVHAAYLPQPEELLWAQRVLAAAAAGAAVAVDGKMIDRPVMIKAEHLVALAMRKR